MGEMKTILRSSASGFAWGNLIFTHYKTACLRWILVSSKVPHEIPEKYEILGKINEDRYETKLKGETYHREIELERPTSVDGVVNRGHVDFLCLGRDDSVVHELKHVQSKNVRREVIKNGRPVTENLAQIVNYMWQSRSTSGKLVYTYYEHDSNNGLPYPLDERIFEIKVDDFGRILIDGVPSKYSMHDQLAHQHQAASVLKEDRVGQRPYNWDAPFVGPCHWCACAPTCAKFDSGAIKGTEAFVESCRNDLNADKESRNE